MKPIILKIWMIVATLLSFMQASAYDFEADGKYYNIISAFDLTCEITAGDTKYSGNIDIPSTVEYKGKTLSVIKIGDKAFAHCENLVSVNMPNSVTEIGNSSFNGCVSFERIDFPQSLTKIGRTAFYECSKIQNVSFPNTLQELGSYAFRSCDGLTSVTIPYLVKLQQGAFCECANLVEIKLPDTMEYIESNTFLDCKNLKSIIIPSGITEVSAFTFSGCSSLESIQLPEGIVSFDHGAFLSCSSLKTIELPNSLNEINSRAFEDCSSLETITIPKGVNDIGYSAFENCTNLKTLILESSENYIRLSNSSGGLNPTFRNSGVENIVTGRGYLTSLRDTGLNNIKDLTLLDGVAAASWFGNSKGTLINLNIGQNVTGYPSDFTGYTKLKTFSINEAVPPTCPKFTTTQYVDMTVYVPAGALSAYQNAEGWKNFWNIKEMGTSGIDDIEADTEKVEVGRYDILGRRVDESHRGFVIIRYSDGSSAKIINR